MRILFSIVLFIAGASTCFSQTNYSFTGSGNWSVASNWSNNMIPPSVLPAGDTIVISPLQGGFCKLDTLQIITENAKLVIGAGVNFIINSNLVIGDNTFYDFPGNVGDSWTYLVTDTLVYSSEDTGTIETYNLTVSVMQNIQLPSGINANMWVYSYPTYKDTNYVYTSGDSTIALFGIYPYQNWTFLPINKLYILPSRLYSSWQYQPDYADMPNAVTMDMQTDITTGQNYFPGTFHFGGFVAHIDEFFIIEEWLANGIGVVKRYYNNVDGSHGIGVRYHKTSWLLTNYHVQ